MEEILTASDRREIWPALPLNAWMTPTPHSHVDADRWQGEACPNSVAEPFLACHILRHHERSDDITGSVRQPNVRIDFDFIDHQLIVQVSDGRMIRIGLEPQSVAAFYANLMEGLSKLDLTVKIYCKPNEVPEPIRFDQDETHRAYDGEYANRFWRILVQADRVFKEFRARFIGKCSPVHFFWGSPDLAVTRFSGRSAPEHPGGVPNLPDWITREAYAQEVSSCGFWPGGGPIPYAAFYSYAYPEPTGFAAASVQPGAAFYSSDLREFVLPYQVVQQSDSPDGILLEFLQTTYDSAANLGKWDRSSLECGGNKKSAV